MKHLIVIAGLLLSLTVTAQNKLGTAIFFCINHYRDSLGVAQLSWDTGIYFRYISVQVQYDGGFDQQSIPILARVFMDEMLDSPEGYLITRPNATKGVCYVTIEVIYVKNPEENSIIKQFPEWVVKVTVGIR